MTLSSVSKRLTKNLSYWQLFNRVGWRQNWRRVSGQSSNETPNWMTTMDQNGWPSCIFTPRRFGSAGIFAGKATGHLQLCSRTTDLGGIGRSLEDKMDTSAVMPPRRTENLTGYSSRIIRIGGLIMDTSQYRTGTRQYREPPTINIRVAWRGGCDASLKRAGKLR